jgi:2-oxoglutarate ferredoxin oxidoreductase subunit beta
MSAVEQYTKKDIDIAWCPGCGNFGILSALKKTLADLAISPKDLVVVSGIGQAAKIPQYFNTNMFNGLHGRSLPVACGIKAINPALHVIAAGGDGDMYGEGGNHFIHTIRRNPNIAHFVHNNMVYGLTKGQASPTSNIGLKTPVQIDAVFEEPLHAVALAITQRASFVARTTSYDEENTVALMKAAIQHKGYALLEILQPCVTFNHTNTYTWFKENSYVLPESHNPYDQQMALKAELESKKIPLGIIYKNDKPYIFEEKLASYQKNK